MINADNAADQMRKLVNAMHKHEVGAASLENCGGGGIIVTEDDITFKALEQLLKVIERQRERTPWNVAGEDG